MRILGVDPGLKICGYGVIDGESPSLRLIEAGIITTKSNKNLEQRLNKIHSLLDELVEEVRPKVLVLEKLYAHYRHPATAFILGHARGVICLLCAQRNIQLFEYSATRIKKAIVGRGHASKVQIRGMIVNLLKIKNISSVFDVTDALALAVAHAHIARV